MDPDLLSRLLAEGEGSRLDYKADAYEFQDAAIDKKAELLKDILAMANAYRDDDAYILLGVKKIPGRPAAPVGITRHLDDADLQQFVNGKTNRVVEFSYRECESGGLTLAAIRIPVQQRPFHLKAQYGPLAPNVVFVRRGSSTGVADLDEIFRMGASSRSRGTPNLELQFADSERLAPLGTEIEVKPLWL